MNLLVKPQSNVKQLDAHVKFHHRRYIPKFKRNCLLPIPQLANFSQQVLPTNCVTLDQLVPQFSSVAQISYIFGFFQQMKHWCFLGTKVFFISDQESFCFGKPFRQPFSVSDIETQQVNNAINKSGQFGS